MCDNLTIEVPHLGISLRPGSKVKLGRFDATLWVLSHGWYSWGGNRPFCGWYLTSIGHPVTTKPLQSTDLDDIYLVEI